MREAGKIRRQIIAKAKGCDEFIHSGALEVHRRTTYLMVEKSGKASRRKCQLN